MNNDNVSKISLKNALRHGKGMHHSTSGVETNVEVKKKGDLFYIYIDDRCNGLNSISAEETWLLLADYLSCELVEDVNFGKPPPKPKKKQWVSL